ncbi:MULTISPECIES: hypothetical protein [Corynebacterium]|uniref:Uncharacterized protein n=1 Tax=Corynebacterium singulare TaxID=161899 RepID=A0ABS9PSB3_9CORY|nr:MULTISPECIES: hypothetical protein [Corynebacterium]MCG7228366.1 hypothetical protein [Corynebacterium minutissimum]MCG7238450.1 hypothetical protein [Corynebacterium minutissimum]MCG7275148.1 hypothetical protein [Corynebacterium singulare]OFT63592.1 hypothetical protein HMPREF3149_00635 [Corynebacterium sp. HMSC05E07]
MKRLHIRSVIVPALASLLVAGTPALAHADTESAAAAYARNLTPDFQQARQSTIASVEEIFSCRNGHAVWCK